VQKFNITKISVKPHRGRRWYLRKTKPILVIYIYYPIDCSPTLTRSSAARCVSPSLANFT